MQSVNPFPISSNHHLTTDYFSLYSKDFIPYVLHIMNDHARMLPNEYNPKDFMVSDYTLCNYFLSPVWKNRGEKCVIARVRQQGKIQEIQNEVQNRPGLLHHVGYY